MANTPLVFDVPEDYLPLTVQLYATSVGQVAPAASGYILTPGIPGQYSAVVPEACVGIYRLTVHDGDGADIAQGYIWIQADDTNTYIANGTYAECLTVKYLQDNVGTAGAQLTSIPWNSSWDAEVQSECADALAVYDPPTKAELDTAAASVVSGVTGAFPANFSALGINASGHILRVVLCDTTTENTDVTTLEYDVTQAIATEIINNVIAGLSGLKPRVITSYDDASLRITLQEGDDYKITDGTHVDILVSLPSGVDGGTCTGSFVAEHRTYKSLRLTGTPAIVNVSGSWYLRHEFTKAQTDNGAGEYDYVSKVITSAGNVITRATGVLEIVRTP